MKFCNYEDCKVRELCEHWHLTKYAVKFIEPEPADYINFSNDISVAEVFFKAAFITKELKKHGITEHELISKSQAAWDDAVKSLVEKQE